MQFCWEGYCGGFLPSFHKTASLALQFVKFCWQRYFSSFSPQAVPCSELLKKTFFRMSASFCAEQPNCNLSSGIPSITKSRSVKDAVMAVGGTTDDLRVLDEFDLLLDRDTFVRADDVWLQHCVNIDIQLVRRARAVLMNLTTLAAPCPDVHHPDASLPTERHSLRSPCSSALEAPHRLPEPPLQTSSVWAGSMPPTFVTSTSDPTTSSSTSVRKPGNDWLETKTSHTMEIDDQSYQMAATDLAISSNSQSFGGVKDALVATPKVDASPPGDILFYHLNQPYEEFSNYYYALFELDGCIWGSVEHFFQASKFRHLPDIYLAVWRAKRPRDAREVAEKNRRNTRNDWAKVKVEVVLLIASLFLESARCKRLSQYQRQLHYRALGAPANMSSCNCQQKCPPIS